MSDVQTLIVICKEDAQALRASDRIKHDSYRQEAERLEHLASWLLDRDALPLPITCHDWPCVLCPAEPGGSCDLGEDRTHYGRGFLYGGMGGEPPRTERCMPTVLTGPALARIALCLGCGERGPIRDSENLAAEDGLDHAYPDWRSYPVVGRFPHADSPKSFEKATAKWMATFGRAFPKGYLANGGPVRTYRQPRGTRHVPAAGPWGNYDVSAGIDPNYVERAQPVAPTEKSVSNRPVETVEVGAQFALDFGAAL